MELLGHMVVLLYGPTLTSVHNYWKNHSFDYTDFCEQSWTIKTTECQRIDTFKIVVLGKALESPLDSKKIKPVNPEANQPWRVIGRIDAKAKAPTPWHPDATSWITGKDPDAGKDWRQEEKGRQRRLLDGITNSNGREFEQIPGDSEGQGSLACYSPWDCRQIWLSDWTTW